ncbi:MAG: mannitol dehydrogenase family protein [Rubrivivax sp.]
MTRLSTATLATVAPEVARPAYERAALKPGIVHLGIGAFARAHLLPITDAAIAATGDLRWGVVGVSLRQPDTRDALAPQQGLYTLALRDAQGTRLQVVGGLLQLLVAPEDEGAVVARIASADTRIVSLTITEKGYHADPGGAADLIARALQRRRATGSGGLTLMSLDNLPSNGRALQRCVQQRAAALDPGLADWIDARCSFPCSMVDRIVPRTTDADRAQVAAALGIDDAWPVVGEPFLDWAVEDRFVAGRPDWTAGGARFVASAEPYEQLKLRMVNGSHSALAYIGALLGLPTVDRAVADADLRGFADALLRVEVQPTLPTLPGLDVDAYRARLLQRFANPSLQHRLLQIAMDGSQKIPQRWLATLRDRLAEGQGIDRLALCVAAWLRFIDGRDEQGATLPLDDPMAEALRAARQGADGGIGHGPVFGDLAQDARFVHAVERASQSLARTGLRPAVRALAG